MKPRERRAPGRWIRSRSGCLARLVRTKLTRDGRWLYRLRFQGGATGPAQWTLDDLEAQRVRWLRRRPAAWRRP